MVLYKVKEIKEDPTPRWLSTKKNQTVYFLQHPPLQFLSMAEMIQIIFVPELINCDPF